MAVGQHGRKYKSCMKKNLKINNKYLHRKLNKNYITAILGFTGSYNYELSNDNTALSRGEAP